MRQQLLQPNIIICSVSIECHYENTAHLEVHSQPGVLQPNKTMEVDFLFYPREPKYYHVIIPFEINGLSTMNVEIFGEGTDMKVYDSLEPQLYLRKMLTPFALSLFKRSKC